MSAMVKRKRTPRPYRRWGRKLVVSCTPATLATLRRYARAYGWTMPETIEHVVQAFDRLAVSRG